MLVVLFAIAGCGTASVPEPVAVEVDGAVTTQLRVEGMTCGSCADRIRTALREEPGVLEVAVNVEGRSATVRHDPDRIPAERVAAAISAAGYPATVGAPPAAADVDEAFGVDPEAAKICQAGCAAQFDYDEADVVAQPGAKVGDLTRCPVSGVVFVVQEDQPRYGSNGQTWYTCCAMCLGKLQEKPSRFVRM